MTRRLRPSALDVAAASRLRPSVADIRRLRMCEARRNRHARLVELQLEVRRAFQAFGDATYARARWEEGIAECVREAPPDHTYGRTYFEQCRALFDELVTMLVNEHRFDEARAVARSEQGPQLAEITRVHVRSC